MPTVDQIFERQQQTPRRPTRILYRPPEPLPQPTPPPPPPPRIELPRPQPPPPPPRIELPRPQPRILPRRGLPMYRPPEPSPQPQTQPANPLQGVAAALGQATRTLQSTLGQVAGQVTSTLQRAGQTIATGARVVAKKAGEFAAWSERQSEELFQGKVTPATVIGTAASFVLPTTIMQIAGGQKKLDIRNPETAIGLGSDILLMIPVAFQFSI